MKAKNKDSDGETSVQDTRGGKREGEMVMVMIQQAGVNDGDVICSVTEAKMKRYIAKLGLVDS